MVADIKKLRKMDSSEIHVRRLSAKEVIMPKKRLQMEQQNCLEEIWNGAREPTPRRDQPVWSEDPQRRT